MSEQDPGDFVAYTVPVTRQNADRGENLDPPVAPVRAMLVFEATLTEPDSAAHFLGTGGPLGAAAAPWTTSFAVSGEDGDKDPATKTREPAVVVPLYQNQPTLVRIPLNPDGVQDPRDKLLVENNRQGAGINGTYGSFYAGGGAQLLARILEQTKDGGATSISLTYAGRAQDGVVTLTKARIEGSKVDMAYADPPRDVARTALRRGHRCSLLLRLPIADDVTNAVRSIFLQVAAEPGRVLKYALGQSISPNKAGLLRRRLLLALGGRRRGPAGLPFALAHYD